MSHHHDDDEDSRRHHFSHHHDRDHSIAHHRAHRNDHPRFETAHAIRRDISAAKKHVTELVNNPGDVTRRLLSSMSGVFTGVSNGGEVQEDTRHNPPDGGTRASGRRRAERDVRALIAANEDLVKAHAQVRVVKQAQMVWMCTGLLSRVIFDTRCDARCCLLIVEAGFATELHAASDCEQDRG